MRKSRTYGSVRGWHREVPVYSTRGKYIYTYFENLSSGYTFQKKSDIDKELHLFLLKRFLQNRECNQMI